MSIVSGGTYQEPIPSWNNSNGPTAVPTLPARGIKRHTSTECSFPRQQQADCNNMLLADNNAAAVSNNIERLQTMHECSIHSLPLNANMSQDVVDSSVIVKNNHHLPLPAAVADINVNRVHSAAVAADIKCMPWFHGMISRDMAEQLLQPRKDGLFLVRESTNFPGDYTLCVCWQNKVEHYRVKYHDRQLTIDDEEFFENLNQLVEVSGSRAIIVQGLLTCLSSDCSTTRRTRTGCARSWCSACLRTPSSTTDGRMILIRKTFCVCKSKRSSAWMPNNLKTV